MQSRWKRGGVGGVGGVLPADGVGRKQHTFGGSAVSTDPASVCAHPELWPL